MPNDFDPFHPANFQKSELSAKPCGGIAGLVHSARPFAYVSRLTLPPGAVFGSASRDFGGGVGNVGAGAEDGVTPAFSRKAVLGGITPPQTTRMSPPLAFLRLDQGRHQRFVARGLARHADDVHVVLDRVAGRFLGRLEQGPISTSKPRSANAVAITLAPRSWPSWPSLATSMRGRRPSPWAKRDLGAQRRKPRRHHMPP